MRDHHHPHRVRLRAGAASVILIGLLAILATAFFRVQVLGSVEWTLQSESNRLRALPVPVPRGTIYDRNGRVVAENVPGYAVIILPAHADTVRATLGRLAPLLELSEGRVDVLHRTLDRYPGQPLLVSGDAEFERVARVQERISDFPGVFVEMRPRRRYNAGEAIGHVIGYVGEISGDELGQERFAEYEQGMVIGKDGLERQYEEQLQGRRGVRYLEVDARGGIVGSFGTEVSDPGEPGDSLRLNLDLDLMEFIHRIFPDSLNGAVVALDPEDGGILALYSAPTIDPNAFVGGIDAVLWDSLQSDPRNPLLNRTVMGAYAPASPFKVVVGAMALDMGVITADETMPEPCTGGFFYGGTYRRCWDPEGHGFVDLEGAIASSCNVYFYQVGLRMGLEPFLEMGNSIGFSDYCGVDLPQERRGTFPQGPEFWEETFNYTPQEGEILSLAIGQGPNSQTPLKMAQFFMALARGGSAPTPSLYVDAPPGHEWNIEISDEAMEAVRGGMRQVMTGDGTAGLSRLEHWEVLGKTGTGQVSGTDLDHAWFVGMVGPHGGDTEIVVLVLVEFGNSGSAAAAPVATKTADYFLRKKYGMPIDTIQTLREYMMVGRPTPWAN